MKAVKVTSKGQITLPVGIRTALGIDDPIWDLVGAGESGVGDTSANHDRSLAEGEMARWRESS